MTSHFTAISSQITGSLQNATYLAGAGDSSPGDQAYNPVTDYLKNCYKKWDKKHRIDDFLPDYLGADRTPANDLIIKLVLMGVVAKAANPNTKFDWVLDLVGGQGVGKTTLLMKLAPPGTYTDQFLSFTDKDDFAAMRNALIVNDDEMTVSNRTSFEEIKKFITMKEFTYRPPYARSNETFKKKFFVPDNQRNSPLEGQVR